MNRNYKDELKNKLMTAEEAVKMVKSGNTVYIGTCTSVAYSLAEALGKRKNELENIKVACSNVLNPIDSLIGEPFTVESYFLGPFERKALASGRTDFTCIHLSQIGLWCTETMPADVAFLEVSRPDENGYMSFGSTGVALCSFIKDTAKTIILEINENAPYVLGEDNLIHISEADAVIEVNRPIFEMESKPVDDMVKTISRYILDQIPDGACIQLGLGGVADGVGYGLEEKNDLGIHTELMTNSMMELMKKGVVTNKRKRFMPGKSVAAFTLGNKELYDFIDHNPDMYYMNFRRSNDSSLIAQNDNMISINAAVAADLFGEIVADNIGGRQYSGVGGQLDFVRGAQMSKGGKSFIAFTSSFINKKGERQSRITASLSLNAAVTTPRADVQYVVTEYGCVNLKTLTMSDRVKAMISIAHPDFREQLRDEAYEKGLLSPYK